MKVGAKGIVTDIDAEEKEYKVSFPGAEGTVDYRYRGISHKEIDSTLHIVESHSSRDITMTIEDKLKRYVVDKVIEDIRKEGNTPQGHTCGVFPPK